MLMAILPELVHLDRAQAGCVDDPKKAFRVIFTAGTDSLSKIGVIGDPRRASAEHGGRVLGSGDRSHAASDGAR